MKKLVWLVLIGLVLMASLQFISANLILRVTDISPSSIEANEDFTVGIQIENDEDYDAKDIILELNYLGEDLQLKENKIINVGKLRRNGGIKNLVYHFRTSSDVIGGQRTIELTLSWNSSESGTSFKKDYNFSVDIISDKPKLTISGIKTEPERVNSKEDIVLTIKVENYGEGAAKNVRLILEGLDFEGVAEVYLGEIEPQEELPARFVFRSNYAKRYDFNSKLIYEFNGKDSSLEFPLSLQVFGKTNYFVIGGVIIIIIVLIAFYVNKKYKIKIKERQSDGKGVGNFSKISTKIKDGK